MEEIKIEKGIPVPVAYIEYPWEKMKVGESFYIEGMSPADIAQSRRKAERKMKAKFVTRTFDGGVRAWRVE